MPSAAAPAPVPTPAPLAPPAAPKTLSSGVEYIRRPQPDYPPLCAAAWARKGALYFARAGRCKGQPERVEVQRSSGFARLDESRQASGAARLVSAAHRRRSSRRGVCDRADHISIKQLTLQKEMPCKLAPMDWKDVDAKAISSPKGVVFLLLSMSIASWYVIVTKAWQLWRFAAMRRTRRNTHFGDTTNLSEGIAMLGSANPYADIAESGLHKRCATTPRTRVICTINCRLATGSPYPCASHSMKHPASCKTGMAVMASVGSTAPFVGCSARYMGIYQRAGYRSAPAVRASIGTRWPVRWARRSS